MTRRLSWRTLAVLLILAQAVALPTAALAEGGGGWGLTPSPAEDGTPRAYFVIQAEAGAVITDSVVVEAGTEAVDLALSSANAMAQPNGGFVIDSSGGQDGPASWVRMAAASLSLEAGKAYAVPFDVVVPEGAAPGVYDAAILAMRVTGSDGEGMRVDSGIGVAVSIIIAGPERCGMTVDGMAAEADILGRWLLVGSARNEGSHPFRGTALLTLANGDGSPVGQWDQRIGYTCAGCDVLITIPLGDAIAGEYTGALALVGDPATTSCTAAWQGGVVVAQAEIEAARETVDNLTRSTVVDRIAGSGGLLLALGLAGLALGVLGLAVLITKRKTHHRKGGGRV